MFFGEFHYGTKPALRILYILHVQEEWMDKCVDCIYFLSHKQSGFNCGYLIKTVDEGNGCCKYFQSVNKSTNT